MWIPVCAERLISLFEHTHMYTLVATYPLKSYFHGANIIKVLR